MCKYWGISWASLVLWALGICQSWIRHSFASSKDVVVSSGKRGCALSRAQSMKGSRKVGFSCLSLTLGFTTQFIYAGAWSGSLRQSSAEGLGAAVFADHGMELVTVCMAKQNQAPLVCAPAGRVGFRFRQENNCLEVKPLILALLQTPHWLQTRTADGLGCHKHNISWFQEQLTQ